jgi:hypothetical protein
MVFIESPFAGVVAARNTLIRAIPVAILGGLLVFALLRISLPLSGVPLGILAMGAGGLLVIPFILPELRLLVRM